MLANRQLDSRFSDAVHAVDLQVTAKSRGYSQSRIDRSEHFEENSAFTSVVNQPYDANDSKYNRKEKSLGELCRRFLSIYGKQQKDFLLLDQCTRELGVERRRIYDIINILESFCVIRRQAKNSYQWRGIDKIIYSIQA